MKPQQATHFATGTPKERANILISVLWIVVILAVIVLGLNYEARSDVERAILTRDRARAYWIARGGVEKAKYEYAVKRQDHLQNAGDEEMPVRFRFETDDGIALIQLRSRTGLMSIQTKNRQVWLQALSFYELPEDEADALVDAILDWTDPNDLPNLNGAEADYYQTLSPAYRPRNAPFQTVDELLLVRGITETMFYGQQGANGKPGLQDMLSNDRRPSSRFDINSCPKAILMAFLEIDDAAAGQIIATRQETPFRDLTEVGNAVTIDRNDLLNQYFTTYKGTQFTIRSTGLVHDSPARYTVEEEVRYIGGARLFAISSHQDFSQKHLDEAQDESMDK